MVDVIGHGDEFLSGSQVHKLEAEGRYLYATAVDGHFQGLFLDYLLEPGGIGLFLRIHIYVDCEGAGELALHAVDFLLRQAELHAKVVEVHPVWHVLRVDGDLLDLRYRFKIRVVHLEFCRDEDCLLNLFRAGYRGIVCDMHAVFANVCLDGVGAGNLDQLALEGH